MLSNLSDLREFFLLWGGFISTHFRHGFLGFEKVKTHIAELLYKQRGKFARPFVHSGMVAISLTGVMLAPIISEQIPTRARIFNAVPLSSVLSAAIGDPETSTVESQKARDKIYEYVVQEGDTISTIAEKYGVSTETITWQNKLDIKKPKIKVGDTLQILPVTGVSHKVAKGETIYSIAKKYQAETQAIVDFPYNSFVNDETFMLAVGQELIIPDGTPPSEVPSPSRFARTTPDAGTVTASGSFVWPTSGRISQGFAWYHKAIDIANSSAPDVLAADSGKIQVAGWPDNNGYGNRVIIEHGNGYRSLYAHLSRVYVTVGQTVRRGDSIGKMGSTGRSTGTHLHFEIHEGGSFRNPLDFLR